MGHAATLPTTTLNGNYRGHIAELDALRGIGIGLVLLAHFWPRSLNFSVFSTGAIGGWIAMDSFFVLSGFLIMGILLDTRSRPDYFRNYYLRRSFRIFPLYYLVLLALFVMTHVSGGGSGAEYTQMLHHWGSPAWFAFYLGNVRMAYIGGFPPVGAYGPLWSLQIEEQFYLLLPLLVRFVPLGRMHRWLWLMVFLSPVFRILFFLWNPKNFFLQFVVLPCHMDGLALGALIALRFRSGPWRISKAGAAATAAGLLLSTAAGIFLSMPAMSTIEAGSNPVFQVASISLSSFGCASLVLWLILFRGSGYTRLLRIAPIQYVSKISYGVYLLHPLAFRVVRWTERFGNRLSPDGFPHFLLLVFISLAMASASWYLLESPLLKLRDRLAPSRAANRISVRA